MIGDRNIQSSSNKMTTALDSLEESGIQTSNSPISASKSLASNNSDNSEDKPESIESNLVHFKNSQQKILQTFQKEDLLSTNQSLSCDKLFYQANQDPKFLESFKNFNALVEKNFSASNDDLFEDSVAASSNFKISDKKNSTDPLQLRSHSSSLNLSNVSDQISETTTSFSITFSPVASPERSLLLEDQDEDDDNNFRNNESDFSNHKVKVKLIESSSKNSNFDNNNNSPNIQIRKPMKVKVLDKKTNKIYEPLASESTNSIRSFNSNPDDFYDNNILYGPGTEKFKSPRDLRHIKKRSKSWFRKSKSKSLILDRCRSLPIENYNQCLPETSTRNAKTTHHHYYHHHQKINSSITNTSQISKQNKEILKLQTTIKNLNSKIYQLTCKKSDIQLQRVSELTAILKANQNLKAHNLQLKADYLDLSNDYDQLITVCHSLVKELETRNENRNIMESLQGQIQILEKRLEQTDQEMGKTKLYDQNFNLKKINNISSNNSYLHKQNLNVNLGCLQINNHTNNNNNNENLLPCSPSPSPFSSAASKSRRRNKRKNNRRQLKETIKNELKKMSAINMVKSFERKLTSCQLPKLSNDGTSDCSLGDDDDEQNDSDSETVFYDCCQDLREIEELCDQI